ncbi:MAG: N-acetylmuramoyl-L-alanine amidase [Candidatus Omnitrophica bacterium]|nr:N-acetylmuramoyl-L-alanine amidase [Candidatus Omnitrophota bacterium]
MSSILAFSRVTIDSVHYLPLSAIAREMRGGFQADGESQVWSMRVGPHELRASPRMGVVLIDQNPQLVSPAPVLRDGELYLPESVFSRWLSGWRAPPLPVRPGRPPSGYLKTVVIDAGHGGKDPGAIGRAGLREKSVTLDIARRMRDLLQQDGLNVVMTRDSDRFISLSRRCQIANQERGDLFVSVHANASRRRSISGYEVYILSDATDDHARALEAAENASLESEVGASASQQTEAIVWDLLYTENRAESRELASSICRGLALTQFSSRNRGVKSARFYVLKGTRMPAILVEVGFVSHPAEEERLRTAEHRQRLAEGIRKGILSFRAQAEKRYAYTP